MLNLKSISIKKKIKKKLFANCGKIQKKNGIKNYKRNNEVHVQLDHKVSMHNNDSGRTFL